jgi:hypothetical protein
MSGNPNHEERWKDRVEGDLRDLRKEMGDLGDEVADLRSAHKWAIGAAGALLWVVGFFSDKLRHLLGI